MYLCMNLWDYTSAKLKTLRARSVNLSTLSRSFTCLSPPFQWQRVEPVPLCRSGKLCSPSYNTQNLASRNTTVASRLIKRAHLPTYSLAHSRLLTEKQSTSSLLYTSTYTERRSIDQFFMCKSFGKLS